MPHRGDMTPSVDDTRRRFIAHAAGTPASITFFARPFGESELLAVVKAYQDATGFHLKHPTLPPAGTGI